ncbi:hypothetical protein [Micromonospora sp. NPDC048898]|uniref:hypothetical protein n=1 Tax=Micromonospora sp. NPDC048898 TaxID=3364260 RepID=UPI003724AF72
MTLGPTGFFADHGGDANDARYVALAAAVGPAYDRTSSHTLRMAYRAELNAALTPAPGMHGVAAAQAAGLRCVAVPNRHTDHARFTAADLVLPSAADLPLDALLARLALGAGSLR